MHLLKNYSHILFIPFLLSAVFSCKKESPLRPDLAERTQTQLLKDSIFHYFNLYSLWSANQPLVDKDVFVFTDRYESANDVLDALKKTTPFNAGYQTNIDRFSYLQTGNEGNSTIGSPGTAQGFGIFATIGAVNSTLAYPVINLVTGGSAAAKAGIKRSDVILAVDEFQDCSIPVTCDDSGCRISDENIRQAVTNRLLTAFQQSSMKIRLRHADLTESTVTINAIPFEIDPVLQHQVLVYPAKSVGYLALSSFEELNPDKQARRSIDQAFVNFEDQNISDLILDLRYNNGGHISAATYIANKIANTDADKALMYKYTINAYLTKQATAGDKQFDPVYFNINGKLKLNTVYFLVSNVTASASELLINILKPYMNVVLIADRQGTFGKPVGYFRQQIMGNNDLYVASFKLSNSRGETDYWNGMVADQQNVTDYIFKDFGDPTENMMAAALKQSVGANPASSRLSYKTSRNSGEKKFKLSTINTIQQRPMLQ